MATTSNEAINSLRARMRRRTTLLNEIATKAGNNAKGCECCAEVFRLAVEAVNCKPGKKDA
jgi:hypothetical protein